MRNRSCRTPRAPSVRVLLIVLTLSALAACQPAQTNAPNAVAPSPVPLSTSTQPLMQVTLLAPTATAMPPTPMPRPTVWIDPVLPTTIHDALVAQVKDLAQQPPGVQLSPDPASDVVIDAHPPQAGETSALLLTRTFAVAVPFPTLADSITLHSLTAYWHGQADALNGLTNDGSPPALFVDPDTRAALVQLLGEPNDQTHVQLAEARDLVATTWAARPASVAILPFDQLEARWKLLWVDGLNLFDKQLDADHYPLTLHVWAHVRKSSLLAWAHRLPVTTNRDVGKLALVAMTGTTAMVRGTAVMMERKGITYPGQLIRDWMTTADVRHVSNEISFWDQCPHPTFNDGLSMCSSPKYMELLKYMGVNVVELSGEHLWDKGAEHVPPTLKMYDEAGMRYFAGGATYTDSLKPLTMTVAGNRLAFVGCNYIGEDLTSPDRDLAGATPCGAHDNHSFDLLIPTIHSLAQQGYLVIASIQYDEFTT
jgi:poly-gamma-glutamate synthesis protein (capsule biosynthesis protein)